MGIFGGGPKIRLNGSQYECQCDLRLPGQLSRCNEKFRGDNEKDVKKMWDKHEKWHKELKKKKINQLKNKYNERVAELLEEYESVHNIPQHKIKGLHTKGIPNVPDGQNVNGLVYDKDGKRVPYSVLKNWVQGWED